MAPERADQAIYYGLHIMKTYVTEACHMSHLCHFLRCGVICDATGPIYIEAHGPNSWVGTLTSANYTYMHSDIRLVSYTGYVDTVLSRRSVNHIRSCTVYATTNECAHIINNLSDCSIIKGELYYIWNHYPTNNMPSYNNTWLHAYWRVSVNKYFGITESEQISTTIHPEGYGHRAPSQYKDRLIYVWRFPC